MFPEQGKENLQIFKVPFSQRCSIAFRAPIINIFDSGSGAFSVIVTVTEIAKGTESDGMILLSILGPCVLQLVLAVGGYFLMHRMVSRKLNLP